MCGIEGNFRNHELRVTCISALSMAGFDKGQICDVTIFFLHFFFFF